jgi:DNA (cytosine-5)-methyltransferase 1
MRLMTFPDLYKVAGNRKAVQRQLGNAVPPMFARVVIQHLLSQMGYVSPVSPEPSQLALA